MFTLREREPKGFFSGLLNDDLNDVLSDIDPLVFIIGVSLFDFGVVT